MGIDIKFPIGSLFTVMGLLLTIYGWTTNNDPVMYSKSLGINVNLWSGLGMLVFGLIMLIFAFRSWKKKTS